ncbi:hypothetical protein L2E82_11146 [Cichorium intybus]|uniref:Uncharacterized protein n=1 Tax=Cichorium intybus TaxID=13427 RepID=A0ACB9GCI2_CICIN|nr:hypothetical protein L2E82_11146 [Cichorium intybus]
MESSLKFFDHTIISVRDSYGSGKPLTGYHVVIYHNIVIFFFKSIMHVYLLQYVSPKNLNILIVPTNFNL